VGEFVSKPGLHSHSQYGRHRPESVRVSGSHRARSSRSTRSSTPSSTPRSLRFSAISGLAQRGRPKAGQYRIDPEYTDVRFTIRHLFGLGAVEGTVKLLEAAIVVGDSPSGTRMLAVLDANSLDTGSAKRDAEVRSAKYLDAEAFPEFVFSCQFIDQQNGKWVAVGELAAHGVTAPIDITLDQFNDTLSGDLALHASATIDRFAHGITAGRGLAGRKLHVTITALAIRARHATGAHWSDARRHTVNA
jgi:polyisoprenoid-binding protein YceI